MFVQLICLPFSPGFPRPFLPGGPFDKIISLKNSIESIPKNKYKKVYLPGGPIGPINDGFSAASCSKYKW